jgi:hypothetical protein
MHVSSKIGKIANCWVLTLSVLTYMLRDVFLQICFGYSFFPSFTEW